MKQILLIGFLWVAVQFKAQAQVLGKVLQTGDACNAPSEVFVSETKSRNLLYQIHVPVGSDFEVKLRPGKYTLRAANKDGCLAEEKINFQKKPMTLALKLSDKKPVKDARAPASAFYCAECQMSGYFPNFYPMQPYFGPYWNNFSSWNYPNYNYPCMWGGWGCGGSHYPHGGPIAMGKPNIYLRGPDFKDVKISLKEDLMADLIATSPAYMDKGWTVSLKNNDIFATGVKVPYLFYDARADLKKLQSKKGFCGSGPSVLEAMSDDLKTANFPSQAISDFNEYWKHKLPPLPRFCVYPQTSKMLDEEIPFEVSGADIKWNRVLYFIVPFPANPSRPPKFLEPFLTGPDDVWVRSREDRAPSSSAVHVAHEWGIAFPFID